MQNMPRWSGLLHMDRSWAAYRDASSSNTRHAHVAMQLCVGHARAPVIIDANGQAVQSRGIAIRRGVPHRLEPSLDVTLVFVEPQSPLARALLDLLPNEPISPMPDDRCDRIATRITLSEILAGMTEIARPDAALDARLEAALTLLVDTHANDAVTLAAQRAGLSPPRLRALAHAQLGVPLAPWVMWRELERAGAAIVTGAGLAEAALTGGFTDQAHFSRAMRRVFGITPGELAALV